MNNKTDRQTAMTDAIKAIYIDSGRRLVSPVNIPSCGRGADPSDQGEELCRLVDGGIELVGLLGHKRGRRAHEMYINENGWNTLAGKPGVGFFRFSLEFMPHLIQPFIGNAVVLAAAGQYQASCEISAREVASWVVWIDADEAGRRLEAYYDSMGLPHVHCFEFMRNRGITGRSI
jgi:hypothetical protein